MNVTTPVPVQEERCPHCGGLLFKWRPASGVRIEIKCRRCRHDDTIVIERKSKDAA